MSQKIVCFAGDENFYDYCQVGHKNDQNQGSPDFFIQ